MELSQETADGSGAGDGNGSKPTFQAKLGLGRNEQPSVSLTSVDGSCSCEIYLLGATVSSWRHCGQERLYLSTLAIFNGAKAIRGGIPLVFPQFGRPDTTMLQHGFARTSLWTYSGSDVSEESITAHFSLEDSAVTRAVWPHKFKLMYHVTLSASSLKSVMEVINTNEAPFECQTLLHTYIRVPDIATTRVEGCMGATYIDQLQNKLQVSETDESVSFEGEVDRIYNFSGSVEEPIYVNESFEHDVEGSPVRIVKDQLMRVDRWAAVNGSKVAVNCVLWNPWVDKAAATADLDDDAYQHFVCIEPGTVSGMTSLGAGEQMMIGQLLTATELQPRVLRQLT